MQLQTQTNNLRQALASDKRPLGFLLGAGCSHSIKTDANEALIPDIAGLTALTLRRLAESDKTKTEIEIVLDATKPHANQPKITIEDVLGYVRELKTVSRGGEVKGLSATQLQDLENAICSEINSVVSKELPTHGSAYEHLARWISQADRNTQAIELFTTNYDLLLEQALERHRVPYFDGFVGSREAFFDIQSIEDVEHEKDSLPGRWARLWKLHGSVNWYQTEPGGSVVRTAAGNSRCSVIHPSHLKYDESRRMPFLAMFDRLKSFLRKPSATLICAGFSFADKHLNTALIEGLRTNRSAVVYGLVRSDLAKYTSAVQAAHAQTNFSLLAKNGCIIGAKSFTWTEGADGKSTICKLGDFAELGQLLADLTGYVPEQS